MSWQPPLWRKRKKMTSSLCNKLGWRVPGISRTNLLLSPSFWSCTCWHLSKLSTSSLEYLSSPLISDMLENVQQLASWEIKAPSFIICLLCRVNTPVGANFKLPMWQQRACRIHENLTTSSSEQRELASAPTAPTSPILHHKVSEEVAFIWFFIHGSHTREQK